MLESKVSTIIKPQSLAIIASALGALYILSLLIECLYNVFFHPLRHIPGPTTAIASRIPYVRHLLKGTIADNIRDLHEKYGEVVRVAPNEVSFISGETAWQDIYGFHHEQGKPVQFQKDQTWFRPSVNGLRNINATDPETHSRMRRALAHAFSDKAIREQEPFLNEYIDKLINGLTDHVRRRPQEPVNFVLWANWTTFDIIGDLTYGESFGCLDNQREHDFVRMAFSAIRAGSQLASAAYFPVIGPYIRYFLSSEAQSAMGNRYKFFDIQVDKVSKRLERDTDRPDFMTQISKDRGEKGLTRPEMDVNSLFLMLAGSETTATMLSGTFYNLLKHPRVLEKLQEEIRGSFTNADEINLLTVNKLPYLEAVIHEGLRFYPPVPWGFPRVVPSGGSTISGYHIPEGTSVYVSQYPTYHSERNFAEPELFAPERWMDDPHFANDNKSAFKPFSFGPRNCLGMNLAYAEMRLIVTRLTFEFNMELVNPQSDWFRQRTFLLWEKPPLMIRMSKARNEQ